VRLEVVRQWLLEVVAEIPADTQAIRCDLHQLTLGAYSLKEHHQLQSEEHYRIDTVASYGGVAVGHQFPDEREVEPLFESAVEIVLRDQLFEGEVVW